MASNSRRAWSTVYWLGAALALATASAATAGELGDGQMGDAKTRAEALVGRLVSTPQGQAVGQIRDVMAGDDGQMMNVQIIRGETLATLRVPRAFVTIAADGGVVVDLTDEQMASFAAEVPARGRID